MWYSPINGPELRKVEELIRLLNQTEESIGSALIAVSPMKVLDIAISNDISHIANVCYTSPISNTDIAVTF